MTLAQAGRASEIRIARRLVQAAGLIFYILSVQGLFAAGVGAYVYFQGGHARDLVLPATGAALAVSYAIVGYFLRRYWVWARNFAFVFSAIGVFLFPIGTVLGSVIVLCIDRANRAGLFPPPAHVRAQAEKKAAEAEESAPILRLEPDLSAESAG
jgi:hypothetical protein